jgi:hypothetical protein
VGDGSFPATGYAFRTGLTSTLSMVNDSRYLTPVSVCMIQTAGANLRLAWAASLVAESCQMSRTFSITTGRATLRAAVTAKRPNGQHKASKFREAGRAAIGTPGRKSGRQNKNGTRKSVWRAKSGCSSKTRTRFSSCPGNSQSGRKFLCRKSVTGRSANRAQSFKFLIDFDQNCTRVLDARTRLAGFALHSPEIALVASAKHNLSPYHWGMTTLIEATGHTSSVPRSEGADRPSQSRPEFFRLPKSGGDPYFGLGRSYYKASSAGTGGSCAFVSAENCAASRWFPMTPLRISSGSKGGPQHEDVVASAIHGMAKSM